MKHVVMALALAVSSGACVEKEQITTGPTVSVEVESTGFGSCRDTSSSGSLDPDEGNYTLSFEVDTTAGKTESADFSTPTEYHPVTKLVGTLAVPNVVIPDSAFEIDPDSADSDNKTFVRHDPVVIPGSAMGQMLTVTVEATDSEGLKGNLIDFSCLLEAP